MPADRSFDYSLALDLDGQYSGLVRSFEGGYAYADVVTEEIGPDGVARKHLSPVRYENLAVRIDLAQGRRLYDWIVSTLQGQCPRHSGAIQKVDWNRNVKMRHEFFNALITEISFPTLDNSSKEPGALTLKFEPEYTSFKKPGGKVPSILPEGGLPAYFRLNIDGLDCTQTNKVAAFTIRQKATAVAVGDVRDYAPGPVQIEFPDLKVTLTAATAQSWYDWFEDFVIGGNCSQEHEKKGLLTLLSSDLNELAHIDLYNLGIFKLTPETDPFTHIEYITAELYCEQMALAVKAAQP